VTNQAGESPLLDVCDLRVHFSTPRGVVKAVDGVSLSIERAKTMGIVGESGSGKSALSSALLGLHARQRTAQVTGQVWLDGVEMVGASEASWRAVRGEKIGMIFQDPMSALHPQYSVGDQIAEGYRAHRHCSRREAYARAIEMLNLVRIPNANSRVKDYPHQFSGGMRQRVVIAMALACEPQLLIADEPTTALDVTIQAEVLGLLRQLQRELSMAIILITHDLGVIAEMADSVIVMYAGRAVEKTTGDEIFERPGHPYTWGLLGSLVRLDEERKDRLTAIAGSPPSLVQVPSGCSFHPRCGYRSWIGERCVVERPDLRMTGQQQEVACHLSDRDREDIRRAPGANVGKSVESPVREEP